MVIFTLLYAAAPILAIAVLLHLLSSRTLRNDKDAHFWSRIDTLGIPSSILPWPRALLGSLTHTQETVREGYKRISTALDRPFGLPTIWTWSAVVVLPPSLLDILHRPDSQLRAFDAQVETIQIPYFITDKAVTHNLIHFDVVRKHMYNGKDVSHLAPAVYDELDAAFREYWGDSTEWKTLNSWDSCGLIITRAVTRILIGLPMCKDPAFLEPSRLFSNFVIMVTIILTCLPPLLRPVLGAMLALPGRYYRYKCLKALVPYVEERTSLWKNQGKEGDAPDDFLLWMLPKCAKEGPAQMDPVRLATRLLAINTMFIITMVYAFSHGVQDIYGSPNHEEVVKGLEEECTFVNSRHHGFMTKEAVDHLHRVDSALRESMRLSDIAIIALSRDVASHDLDIGNGLLLPQGTRVVFPTHAIHRDPDNYEIPLQFDAFRFSRRFEKQDQVEDEDPGERELLTSITPSFLAFGYGKHSCPGRFFASQTMKQALAHLVLHYDVEVCGRLDNRKILLNMIFPRTNVQLRIRRKP
ncbi:cytochrome P450 [Xylaria grammica]|nr:cytochrome P450 [Xylaria grammica]